MPPAPSTEAPAAGVAPAPAEIEAHLDAFAAEVGRWQLGAEAGRHAGGLRCPVARIPLQWTEFFALPVVLHAREQGRVEGLDVLAAGLVDYLDRVQRSDGTFDAGFCGDLAQPCNAAFALRPLSLALQAWPGALGAERRARLAGVVERAAAACVEGGMNTANHRWVAACGLAHASRALDAPRLALAAEEWTRAGADIDADGAWSEGSPNYALVSCDAFLDLEDLLGRRDLGDLARRSLRYLRAVMLPDGGFAAVGSSRYDTEGSSDGYARAARVLERLGEPALADRALARLWRARVAPGVMAPHVFPPFGEAPKAKLYPSVTSANSAVHLMRWLELARRGPAPAVPEGSWERLPAAGLAVYRCGRFALAAGRGRNLLEVHHGEAVLEGVRLLGHATGWNDLLVTDQRLEDAGVVWEASTAPGTELVRLPQFHREAPRERRPGNAVPAITARLRLAAGPGPEARLDVEIQGPEGANVLLELAGRPDQGLAGGDGARLTPPAAAPPEGRAVLVGPGADRLLIDHRGGSGHALQVERYGYASGDALWSPSFRPVSLRIGAELPARLQLVLRGL